MKSLLGSGRVNLKKFFRFILNIRFKFLVQAKKVFFSFTKFLSETLYVECFGLSD